MDDRERASAHALEASAWLEALRNPTSKVNAEFVAWLKQSPSNVLEFLMLHSVEKALGEMGRYRLRDLTALLDKIGVPR
jgi:hypothetical protein